MLPLLVNPPFVCVCVELFTLPLDWILVDPVAGTLGGLPCSWAAEIEVLFAARSAAGAAVSGGVKGSR